jgi:hypothetical protein
LPNIVSFPYPDTLVLEGGYMPIDKNPQFSSRNGFTYVYNNEIKKWLQYCYTTQLPVDVKDKIKEEMEKAEILKEAISII